VVVRFLGDGCPQVGLRVADGLTGERVAGEFQEVEMPKGVRGFAFGEVAKHATYVGVAIDVGPSGEIDVAPIPPAFSCECGFQVLPALSVSQFSVVSQSICPFQRGNPREILQLYGRRLEWIRGGCQGHSLWSRGLAGSLKAAAVRRCALPITAKEERAHAFSFRDQESVSNTAGSG
jgi:hypothetical protein